MSRTSKIRSGHGSPTKVGESENFRRAKFASLGQTEAFLRIQNFNRTHFVESLAIEELINEIRQDPQKDRHQPQCTFDNLPNGKMLVR